METGRDDCEALVREMEAGTLPAELMAKIDESRMRTDYATTPENAGSLRTARVQREVAANPVQNRQRREKHLMEALMARGVSGGALDGHCLFDSTNEVTRQLQVLPSSVE